MEYQKELSDKYYPILDNRFSGFVVLKDTDGSSEKPDAE